MAEDERREPMPLDEAAVEPELVQPNASGHIDTDAGVGHGAPRPRRVYQASGTTWAAFGAGVGGVLFAVLAASGGRGAVVAGVGAGALLVLACRMSTVGIRVRADKVIVASTFFSRSVGWNEIDHFAVLPLGRFPYVGYVVLRNGRKYGTFGLSTSAGQSESKRLRMQGAIDELNEILAERHLVSP